MITKRPLLFAAGLLAGVALAGCGKGADNISAEQMEQTCTTVARSICTRITRCQVAFRLARDYQDADCQKVEHDRCFRTLKRQNTGDSVKSLEDCARARDSQDCPEFLAGVAPVACDTPKGPLTDGAPCVSSAQCASQYCDVATTGLCGSCKARLAVGGACDANGDCQTGLYCKKAAATDLTGVCAKRGAEGEACNSETVCLSLLVCSGAHMEGMVAVDGACHSRTAVADQPCNDSRVCLRGLSCVGFNRTKMMDGVCKVQGLVEGAPCGAQNAGCDGDADLYCFTDPNDKAIRTCKKRTYSGAGGMCGTLADGSDAGCKDAAACNKMLANDPANPTKRIDPGMCVRQVGMGMPCNASGLDGAGCVPGLSCILSAAGAKTGTCQFRDYQLCGMKK